MSDSHLPLVPSHQRWRRPADRGRRPRRRPGAVRTTAQRVVPRAGRAGRGGRRLRGRPDSDGCVVRRRLVVHGDAQPGLGAAEVPGRVPARPDLTVPGGADGRDVPEPHRRSTAAQRRHRGREPRAADVRRLRGQGRTLRTLRRVPHRRPRALAWRDRRPRRRAPAGGGRAARADPRPGARDLLRWFVAGRRRRRGPPRRRLPHVGRAAGRRTREDRVDPRARRRPRGG